jgi:hypothetical protein
LGLQFVIAGDTNDTEDHHPQHLNRAVHPAFRHRRAEPMGMSEIFEDLVSPNCTIAVIGSG